MAEDQVNAPQEQSDAQAAAPTSPDAVATDVPVTEAAATDAPVAEEAQVVSQPAPPLAPGKQFIWGTGRRKTAVARVRIRPGTGKFIVDGRTIKVPWRMK